MEELITRFSEHGYVAIFVLMLLDNVGVPLPSEIPLLFGGFLVSEGRLDYVAVSLVAAIGSLVGALLAYAIGRTAGRALALRFGRYIAFTEDDLARAERWFERRGEAAVFFCRMIPLARTFISIPAGIAEMNVTRFTAYSFAGSLPWVFALIATGWGLGDSWRRVLGSFSTASIVIASILAMVVVVWILRRRLAQRPR